MLKLISITSTHDFSGKAEHTARVTFSDSEHPERPEVSLTLPLLIFESTARASFMARLECASEESRGAAGIFDFEGQGR